MTLDPVRVNEVLVQTEEMLVSRRDLDPRGVARGR
jgi:hypothetical protein